MPDNKKSRRIMMSASSRACIRLREYMRDHAMAATPRHAEMRTSIAGSSRAQVFLVSTVCEWIFKTLKMIYACGSTHSDILFLEQYIDR